MRQIPWEFFRQRRGISFISFKNMSYEQFVSWCARRNIAPIEQSAFDKEISLINAKPAKETKKVAPKVEPQPVAKFDPKQLSKKKKADLVEICTGLELDITGKETKKQLIQLIQNEHTA